MQILRRLTLSRLILLCAATIAIGISVTALALALDSGPTPPAKPLAQAVHDALAATPVQGYSASIQLTDRLVEGSELASGGGQAGGIASNPLLTGASGRLWVSNDGRARLELQAEKGDTQILYDGHTVTIYDGASNTLYRYTPKQAAGASSDSTQTQPDQAHQAPSLADIETSIANLRKKAGVSGATPDDVAGQPAYTVRLTPSESGSLLGGAELSFDSVHGVPLRAAIYSSKSSSPVIELATKEVTFGPVDSSVFSFTPPADAKVQNIEAPSSSTGGSHDGSAQKPDITTSGHGLSSIAILRTKSKSGGEGASSMEGLPQVKIGASTASELKTELGTILTFERSGIRYVLAGAVEPAAVEALAKGL